jgi:hypothetical protein
LLTLCYLCISSITLRFLHLVLEIAPY